MPRSHFFLLPLPKSFVTSGGHTRFSSSTWNPKVDQSTGPACGGDWPSPAGHFALGNQSRDRPLQAYLILNGVGPFFLRSVYLVDPHPQPSPHFSIIGRLPSRQASSMKNLRKTTKISRKKNKQTNKQKTNTPVLAVFFLDFELGRPKWDCEAGALLFESGGPCLLGWRGPFLLQKRWVGVL